MDGNELLNLINAGETSKVQFKELFNNAESLAAEIVAMANSKGGVIIFGIKDKTGEIAGLNYTQIQNINQKVATIASDSVKPQVFINTEVVSIPVDCVNKNILIVNIDEGISKPYKDNQGRIWIKQGSDKRRLTDNHELVRLFQQSGFLYTDEMIVPSTSINDIEKDRIKQYLLAIGMPSLDILEMAETELYQNINLLKNNHLTLGGTLFFTAFPQKFRPTFCVKAVSFFGNNIAGTDYRDSVDITGTIPNMFDESMGFFKRSLQHRQNGQNFNSTGIFEISIIALEELIQNALTHRDYSKNSPILIFIFDNRIEIISPGALPNNLTVENIKMGNAVVRNPLIVSYASKLMKYRGIGSGIRRALKEQPNIDFINDVEGEQFKVIIPRPQRQ